MTNGNWKPINTAPVGPTILLTNENHPEVVAGYGEWFSAPMPRWIACDQTGMGRFKATHWQEMPAGMVVAE